MYIMYPATDNDKYVLICYYVSLIFSTMDIITNAFIISIFGGFRIFQRIIVDLNTSIIPVLLILFIFYWENINSCVSLYVHSGDNGWMQPDTSIV